MDNNKSPVVVENGEIPPIGVFSFENQYALENEGGNYYRANAGTGEATGMDTGVLQGFLEASTVDMAREMTKMIEAQRAFQFNAKLIQVTDEIEHTANTLR